MEILITAVFCVGILSWLVFMLGQSPPVRKMGGIAYFFGSLVIGLVWGALAFKLNLFPREYGGLCVGVVGGLSGLIGSVSSDYVNHKKVEEKLNWFLETKDNEILTRALDKSYESVWQKEDDIAQLGEMIGDKRRAMEFLTSVKRA